MSYSKTDTNKYGECQLAPQAYGDGVTNNGSTTFTSATATFTAADVGKTISVVGATAAAGIHNATINSVNSGTNITMSAAAGTSLIGASFRVRGRFPGEIELYNLTANPDEMTNLTPGLQITDTLPPAYAQLLRDLQAKLARSKVS